MFLGQEIRDAFGGTSPVYELCDDWLEAAREAGITVEDEDGDILPAVIQTIMPALTAAFWSGLTTGHHTIAGGRYFVPASSCPTAGARPAAGAEAHGERGGRIRLRAGPARRRGPVRAVLPGGCEVSAGGKLWAVRVKEPGMKIGVLLSSNGTLVNRWVYAATMPREQADRTAAQIRPAGDEAKVVPFGPKPQPRRRQ